MNIRLGFLGVLALVAVSTTVADEPWVVREDGAGPVRVGMTLRKLNTTLDERFMRPKDKDEQACFYVTPKSHPKVAFMLLDGHLGRIDVRKTGIKTSTGIQVGDSEERALEVYGKRLKVESHKYIDNGHYLTAKSSDGRHGIRFETEDGKITSFYAGQYEAILYVEGCL
jgi:hypothetical protein